MVKANNGITHLKRGLKTVLKKFRDHTKNPEVFLTAQTTRAEKIKELVKSLYDYGQTLDCSESLKGSKPYLDELVVEEMDEEQIWQQLELMNEHLLADDLPKTCKLLSVSEKRLQLPFRADNGEDDDGQQEDEEMTHEDELEEQEEVTPSKPKKKANKSGEKKAKKKKSIVDDEFFKLEDMARFLDEEDAREMRRQAGKSEKNPLIEIDYFSENVEEDEDSEGEDMKYADFFEDDEDENENWEEEDDDDGQSDGGENDENDGEQDENDDEMDRESNESEVEDGDEKVEDDDSEDEVERNRRLRFELYSNSGDFMPGSYTSKPDESLSKSDEDDDVENEKEQEEEQEKEDEKDEKENGPKSSFELRQEKLKQKIQKMESQLMQDKPWQLKGEISADTRPQNSLLEEVLEFESTTRPAPVITEETTMRLEDIIKQRIKNKAYDDVERKIRPPDNPREYRKQLVLDSEKSKESLAQIYEKDYLKQLKDVNPDAQETDEEEPKEHKEIRNIMKTLLAQLDALSNFHYTPRPAVPDLKIITNTPAINMEEVAPVATSDATLLAPEEVHNRPKGDVMAKGERTKTDKNRERRLKKRFQREKFQRQAEKEQKQLEKGFKPKGKDLQEKLLKKVSQAKNVSAMAETKGVAKSSTVFFSQLQDEVSSQIKSKTDPGRKKNKKNGANAGVQATHIKL